ncbi:hypothetical protein FPQ18DRAFT_381640 [Pyronema domesticum]|nr:hypothetical protein FPQ18DRAFT_381640 [Pyronema domesticum]
MILHPSNYPLLCNSSVIFIPPPLHLSPCLYLHKNTRSIAQLSFAFLLLSSVGNTQYRLIDYDTLVWVLGFGSILLFVSASGIDPYCNFVEPNGSAQSVEEILVLCAYFTAHRFDASEASPVPIETPLFMHNDKAVDQLVRLVRDTDMGTRRYRLRREALLNGEEDGPGQFGQEWPEDRATQEEWERDRDQESLFE